jgi:hypothetical protein
MQVKLQASRPKERRKERKRKRDEKTGEDEEDNVQRRCAGKMQ